MAGAIICENLTKIYTGRRVLDNLTLQVPENIVFGFLGPNGAGKSTTMKLLTGQIKPTSGKAMVAGIDVAALPAKGRQRLGYLSEMPNFYPWMRGHELLEFVGEIFGLNPNQRRARAKELLRLVGIEDAGALKVGTFSGGMRQRLGIAQALVNHPEVIFLDEPVSALDPIGRRDVLDLLNNLRQEATVFMSSHVLADVDKVCEQVAILNQGKLIISGSTAEIKEKFAPFSLEVVVKNNREAQRLAESLRDREGIKKVNNLEYGRLQIELAGEKEMNEAGRFIPALIINLDLTLISYNAATPGLEEVFIKLVNHPREPD